MPPSDDTALCEALLHVFDAGVVICTRDGAILMHNEPAARLLAAGPERTADGPGGAPRNGQPAAALDGASLFECIDQRLLQDAFGEVEAAAAGEPAPSAVFATTVAPDRVLRVKVLPMPPTAQGAARFVLHLRPMAPWSEADAARHRFVQALAEGLRDPLASIRAAVETMIEYPHMAGDVAAQFKAIALEQSVVLGEQLDAATDAYTRAYRAQWPLDEMAGHELLALVQARLRAQLDIPVKAVLAAEAEGVRRVRVDTHALPAALTFLAQRIANAAQCEHLTVRLAPAPRLVALDLQWAGGGVSRKRIDKWRGETIHLRESVIAMTLREIIDRHDAEMWLHEAPDGDAPSLRIVLPRA